MKIHIVVATFPAFTCGIADYTARIAEQMASHHDVTVLTAQRPTLISIPGVRVVPAFAPDDLKSIGRIARTIDEDQPDWILLQYDPFAYDPNGLNIHLPRTLHQVLRRNRATRLAVMVHEIEKPVRNWRHRLTNRIRGSYFTALANSATVLFFAIDPWVQHYRARFPRKAMLHLPVGSNITRFPLDRAEARSRLDIAPDALVLGLFGRLQATQALEMVVEAARAVRAAGKRVTLLYIGAYARELPAELQGMHCIAEGPLPADEVSRRIAAVDIYLAPFHEGISTRRTSLMAYLEHGIALVGTTGQATDEVLRGAAERAMLLSPVGNAGQFAANVLRLAANDELRAELGCEASRLYRDEFAPDRITERLVQTLEQHAFHPLR